MPNERAIPANQKILIGTYRQPVLGEDGLPVLRVPKDWKGPVVERLAIPTRAECGPQFTGMPVICTSRIAPGRRWYKCAVGIREVPVPPDGVDLLGSTYERDYERWECQPGYETLCIRLHSAVIERYLQDDGHRFDIQTGYAHKDEILIRFMHEFAVEIQRGMPNGVLFSEGLSLTILGWLRQHYALKTSQTTVPKGVFGLAQKNRIREFIDTNLGAEMTLETMAMEVGMSPFHFLRLFRSSFGTTPHRYLLQARIAFAARILRAQPERSISDIALAMGFSSQAHFTLAFKRQLGYTPANWRSGDTEA